MVMVRGSPRLPLTVHVCSTGSRVAEAEGWLAFPVNFDIWNIFEIRDLDLGHLRLVKLKALNDFAWAVVLFDWTGEKEPAVAHHGCNDWILRKYKISFWITVRVGTEKW